MRDVSKRIARANQVPPVSATYAKLRDEHLLALATSLAKHKTPTLVVGDLNTTPWSYIFGELLTRSRLANCAAAFGVLPTWHANHPIIKIPIDHCLHSKDVRIHDLQVGPNVDSDHLPLTAHISLVGSTRE